MRINTNISAMIANNSLQKAQDNLSLSIERLSSGYKINGSEDDPAGCAISEKMRMQIKGLDRADTNATDGESVLNTAEGALQEINSMLSRMKELTVQAANDVNSDVEREAIQDELDSINKEIDRITEETEFNTQPLLNGNLQRRVYSNVQGVVNLSVSDNYTAGKYGLTVTQDARQAVAVGRQRIQMTSSEKITADEAGTVSINGYNVSISEGDDLNTVISNLMAGADKAGGKVFATKTLANDTTDKSLVTSGAGGNGTDYAGYDATSDYSGSYLIFMTDEYGSDMSLDITCTNEALAKKLGIDDAYVTDSNPSGLSAQGLDVQVEFTTDASGNRIGFSDSAVTSTDGTIITVTDVNGREFKFDVPGNVAGTQFYDITEESQADGNANNKSKDIVQEVTDVGTMSIHIGANQDQVIVLDIPAVTSYTLGLDQINVMTGLTSQQAIAKVDEAIDSVNAVRSKIGAYSNRFEHTRNNLAVSSENAEKSLSAMMDTDMAEEMTNYTSLNVLTQAATSILSQANERPSTVLQILQ